MAASPPLTPHDDLPSFLDNTAPSLASPSSTALARFEYEAGRTSVADATKVLLIEWEDAPSIRGRRGQYAIEWKGRREVLAAGATAADPLKEEHASPLESKHSDTSDATKSSLKHRSSPDTHRLYFLLPPGAAVPPSVAITFTLEGEDVPASTTAIPTLPAIFPPSLCSSATSTGKKGVLHTLWAKSRVGALQAEILAEEQANIEGIGLEMAKSELEWICENFGVGPRATAQQTGAVNAGGMSAVEMPNVPPNSSATAPSAASPISPHSNERFLSKMRGLRVGTGSSDPGILTPPQTGSANAGGKNPLSPDVGDVAVGSFAAIKGQANALRTNAASTATAPTTTPAPAPKARTVLVQPPASWASGTGAQMGSLNSIAAGGTAKHDEDDDEPDDGLFALPMSPRSPDMAKSPFSFDFRDVVHAGGAR